jgi:ArsR family transcriptional regulator, arsenate/arsenite/antimonite-responsive transcriptional repressor
MDTPQITFAKILADETRLEIINLLCCQWLTVNEVVERLSRKVSQPTVSHHLKELEQANLVQMRQEGKYRHYTLNHEEVMCCYRDLFGLINQTHTVEFIPVEAIQGGSC